jgi:hypothetical protein
MSSQPQLADGRASLLYSVVTARVDTLSQRAEGWQRQLGRLGAGLPAFVIHDLGLLLAVPTQQLEIKPAAPSAATDLPGEHELTQQYRDFIGELSQCRLCQAAPRLKPSDEVIVALLARLLARFANKASRLQGNRAALAKFCMKSLSDDRLYLLTLADALDTDALRLIGMLDNGHNRGALGALDVLAALDAPDSTSIVQFSLQILPSVLEVKSKQALSPFAAFGYAGLSHRGSPDSLVLSELAWDEPELARRLMENEVLYYAREQGEKQTKRRHQLLIDASASMRGQRATFARGMALTTAKKLLMTGDDVSISFFDSRLYESHPCRNGKLPVTHVLSFHGEHGRNPNHVFLDLLKRLRGPHQADSGQVVHVFSHAALYIPRALVVELSNLAALSMVFMLPSAGSLQLDYLDLLTQHWVVDADTLRDGSSRQRTAQRILQDVERPREQGSGAKEAP